MSNKSLVLKVFLASLFVGATVVFGADSGSGDFGEFNDVVSSADSAAKQTIGVVGKWFIGLLPLFGLVVGIFGGNKFLKKNSNGQEENFAKQLGFMGAGAFIGLIVSILLITAVGAGLLGDSSLAFGVLNDFWKSILGVSGTAA